MRLTRSIRAQRLVAVAEAGHRDEARRALQPPVHILAEIGMVEHALQCVGGGASATAARGCRRSSSRRYRRAPAGSAYRGQTAPRQTGGGGGSGPWPHRETRRAPDRPVSKRSDSTGSAMGGNIGAERRVMETNSPKIASLFCAKPLACRLRPCVLTGPGNDFHPPAPLSPAITPCPPSPTPRSTSARRSASMSIGRCPPSRRRTSTCRKSIRPNVFDPDTTLAILAGFCA